VKKTKVPSVVKALPGVRDVRVRQLLVQAEIAENRRINGVGPRQRAALLAAVG
jgi:hypothetical protein